MIPFWMTERQRKVLDGRLAGRSYRSIGAELGVSGTMAARAMSRIDAKLAHQPDPLDMDPEIVRRRIGAA